MRTLSHIANLIPAALLALLLVGGFSATSAEARDHIVVTTGVVAVQGGDVVVLTRDGRSLVPNNGQGLMRAGKISLGEQVTVRVVTDRGHEHRGHVTILK